MRTGETLNVAAGARKPLEMLVLFTDERSQHTVGNGSPPGPWPLTPSDPVLLRVFQCCEWAGVLGTIPVSFPALCLSMDS